MSGFHHFSDFYLHLQNNRGGYNFIFGTHSVDSDFFNYNISVLLSALIYCVVKAEISEMDPSKPEQTKPKLCLRLDTTQMLVGLRELSVLMLVKL